MTTTTTSSTVYLWRAWGRVGGQGGGGTKLEGFGSIPQTKTEFAKLFKKQTGNEWEDRKTFVKHPGKFFQLDVSYYAKDDDEDDSDSDGGTGKKVKLAVGDPNSKLPLRVPPVISAMFDSSIATTQLKSLEIDLGKMPLGKLKLSQLKDAYSVLTEIEQLLNEDASQAAGPNTEAIRTGKLRQLSNQFYTKCLSTDPGLIDSVALLKNKIKMVDELIGLQASNSVMNSSQSTDNLKNLQKPPSTKRTTSSRLPWRHWIQQEINMPHSKSTSRTLGTLRSLVCRVGPLLIGDASASLMPSRYKENEKRIDLPKVAGKSSSLVAWWPN